MPHPLEDIDASQTFFDLLLLIKEARRIGGFSPKPPPKLLFGFLLSNTNLKKECNRW
ncbi:hypothetical protein FDUTEX481_02583 [Tolypothrix sp. PCC 7601]|nr:hypothetical protein FDUTEX481_02583 [Tolypothrix sp. PCC 7601]